MTRKRFIKKTMAAGFNKREATQMAIGASSEYSYDFLYAAQGYSRAHKRLSAQMAPMLKQLSVAATVCKSMFSVFAAVLARTGIRTLEEGIPAADDSTLIAEVR